MTLPEAIKAIRRERGISQAEMARRLDMERGNYPRLENRDNKLTLEQIEKIAGALGIGLIELLTWGDSKPESGQSDRALAQENEQLKKRVAELEKWLEDKEEVIQAKQFDIQRYSNEIASSLDHLLVEWAITNKVGKLNVEIYGRRKSAHLFTIPADNKEINKLVEETQKDRNIRAGAMTLKIELTEEERVEVVEGFLKDKTGTLEERFFYEVLFKHTSRTVYKDWSDAYVKFITIDNLMFWEH